VFCGYLVLFITPGSHFFTRKKRWEAKSLDLEQEQVLCGYLVLCVSPGSPAFLLPPKEVGSKESGSRARVVRVFGFVCNRFPLFFTTKISVKKEYRPRAFVIRALSLVITSGSRSWVTF
jgi:hypothetical protein